jgi:hypothetical protein
MLNASAEVIEKSHNPREEDIERWIRSTIDLVLSQKLRHLSRPHELFARKRFHAATRHRAMSGYGSMG